MNLIKIHKSNTYPYIHLLMELLLTALEVTLLGDLKNIRMTQDVQCK